MRFLEISQVSRIFRSSNVGSLSPYLAGSASTIRYFVIFAETGNSTVPIGSTLNERPFDETLNRLQKTSEFAFYEFCNCATIDVSTRTSLREYRSFNVDLRLDSRKKLAHKLLVS